MWLKRSTPQNIVIGGAAGAFPPMIGWAAATGSISIEPVMLFAIIFFWTPPHFWALALLRADEYSRAGVPMLPVRRRPRRDAPANPHLLADARAAWRYALCVRLCRPRVWRGRHCWRRRLPGAGDARLPLGDAPGSDAAAKALFGYSILYLFMLFAVMLVENRAQVCSGKFWARGRERRTCFDG